MSRFDAAESMRLHPAGRSLRTGLRSSEETLINKAVRLTRPRPPFEAEVEHHLDVMVVRLKGELDIAQVHRLEALHSRTGGPARVMLDLSGLTFIDLAVVRHLLHKKRQSDRRGHTFILTGASGAVRRLFDLMGVQHLLSGPEKELCAS